MNFIISVHNYIMLMYDIETQYFDLQRQFSICIHLSLVGFTMHNNEDNSVKNLHTQTIYVYTREQIMNTYTAIIIYPMAIVINFLY